MNAPRKIILHLVHDDYSGELTDHHELTPSVAAAYEESGFIWKVDDSEYDDFDEYRLSEEILIDWDPSQFTLADLNTLWALEPLLHRPTSHQLDDYSALELINYALSAPEWSVSFLEDIADIVRRTGRTEIRGATWDRH